MSGWLTIMWLGKRAPGHASGTNDIARGVSAIGMCIFVLIRFYRSTRYNTVNNENHSNHQNHYIIYESRISCNTIITMCLLLPFGDGAASGGCYGPWPRALCLVGIVYYVGQNLAVWDILAIMRSKPSPLRASSLVLGLAG